MNNLVKVDMKPVRLKPSPVCFDGYDLEYHVNVNNSPCKSDTIEKAESRSMSDSIASSSSSTISIDIDNDEESPHIDSEFDVSCVTGYHEDVSDGPVTLHHFSPLLPNHDAEHHNLFWTAMIVLNAPISCPPSPLFERLWSSSTYHVCADGGANRLYQATSASEQFDKYIPDLITGDLDSLKPHVEEVYSSRGVTIEPVADQDRNDLDKSITAAIRAFNAMLLQQSSLSIFYESNNLIETKSDEVHDGSHDYTSDNDVGNCRKYLRLIVYGAFGGRFDQEMASMQALYRYANIQIILYNDRTMSFLLDGGLNIEHKIHLALPCSTEETDDNNSHVGEGYTCGLIPVGGPVDSVTTSGLQWNLENDPTSFGGLVSTSNRIIAPEVTVCTSQPIVFTTEIHSGLTNCVWV